MGDQINKPIGKKLNLGCGLDIRPDYTNLDYIPAHGVDVVHNWDILPLPFDDDRFIEIFMGDVLEHIPHRAYGTQGEFFIAFINELIRISQPAAIWFIASPRHPISLRSSCHTRLISPVTFEPWTVNEISLESNIQPVCLKILQVKRIWNWNIYDLSRFGKCMRNEIIIQVIK